MLAAENDIVDPDSSYVRLPPEIKKRSLTVCVIGCLLLVRLRHTAQILLIRTRVARTCRYTIRKKCAFFFCCAWVIFSFLADVVLVLSTAGDSRGVQSRGELALFTESQSA